VKCKLSIDTHREGPPIMQRYSETREASGELLRLILPLLARQPAGYHPISYALWYEYAAGINPALKADVDKFMASGVPLDDQTVSMLHEKHIAKRDDAVSTKLRAELEHMLHDLSRIASATGEQATAYSKSLGGFGEQLKPGIDPEQLKEAVQSMLEKTEQMCARTSELELQLQDSGREVEMLRAELVRAKGEALTDPLTGIANRRGFMKTIETLQALNGGGFAHSCLIAVDIDHFKKCNDDYGHLFGDKVIRSVAQILRKMIKGQDTAARIGGEEFVVFLPDTPIAGAEKLAEQIRATIAAGRISTANAGEVGKITISLGLTEYRPNDSIESYLARADKALYASKTGGRNRVTVDAVNARSGNYATTSDPAVIRGRENVPTKVRH
jgi:diguanylate cyclase